MIFRYLCISSLALFLFSAVSCIPAGESEQEFYYRGVVQSMQKDEEGDLSVIGGKAQVVAVKLTGGPFKDRVVSVTYFHDPADPRYNIVIKEGTEVIVRDAEGNLEQVYFQDLARDRGLYYLMAIFAGILFLLGGTKGLKTIISLVITFFLVFKVLIPQMLQGHNPILLAVLVASGAVVFTFLLVSGANVKTLSAAVGTVAGVVIAGILAMWAGNISYLTGFGAHEAQELVYLDHTLDIRGILFAGIIIGSLGAITDVGISVASAAVEIREANPRIGFTGLMVGALNVGRDVVGTMSNTLMLAYVGAATPLLLLVTGHHMSWLKIFNMELVATEVVRVLAGSIGLVAAVPVTAFLAGLLISTRSSKAHPSRFPVSHGLYARRRSVPGRNIGRDGRNSGEFKKNYD